MYIGRSLDERTGKMINERKRPANQQRLLAVRTHRRKIKGGKKVSSFIHEANYYGATRPVWINSRTIDEKRENKTFSKFSSAFSAESLSLAKRIFLGFQLDIAMDVDYILYKIGVVGWYPVGIYFYTLFMVCTYCWQMMAHDYGKWTPDFTCAVSDRALCVFSREDLHFTRSRTYIDGINSILFNIKAPTATHPRPSN